MRIIAFLVTGIMLGITIQVFLQYRKRNKIEYWNALIKINEEYIIQNEILIRGIRDYFKDAISENMTATLNRLQKCINQASDENVELLRKLNEIQK